MTFTNESHRRSILFVTTIPSTLKAFLFPFADMFQAKGWKVDAAAAGIRSFDSCSRIFNGIYDIPFSRKPFHFGQFCQAARAIRELVDRKGYDVVYVHTPIAAFVTRLALRRIRAEGKVKIVYTAHGFHFYRGGPLCSNILYRTLEKWASRWTDHLFVINKEDYEAACSFYPPSRVTYLSGGIGLDLNNYNPLSVSEEDVMALRKELALRQEPIVLMVGEFIKRKRHEDLIRAFAMIKTVGPLPHLLLVGTGPLEEAMKKLACTVGLAERVHFLGYRRDVNVLLKAAKVLVLPSLQEGLPRCVMEAIVMGTPVIGSDIRGTRDLIRLAQGCTFPVGDIQALAKALEEAVTLYSLPSPDEELRQLFNVEGIAASVYRIVLGLFN